MTPELEEERQELAEIANRLTLKEKLAAVALHCAHVPKDGVNLFHKYNYATAATVFERVNEALAEQRLISIPRFEIVSEKERTNAKGGAENLVTVKCELRIIDVDASDTIGTLESMPTNGFGSGQDNGDKAVMKAQTAALKYAWMMLLNISTGDDPEDDAKVDSRMAGEPIQKRQTPEEYQAKVERNKAATLSPLAVKLSEEIKASLAQEMEASANRVTETCKCGSMLVQKTTSKAKGSRPYLVCDLSDRAFRKEEFAVSAMAKLAANGACTEKEHTWRWVT